MKIAPLLFATLLVAHQAGASTVTPVSVSLRELVTSAPLIVIGTIKNTLVFAAPNPTKKEPGLGYLEVTIQQILKNPDRAVASSLKGKTIAIFDPQETFYQEHAAMIAAGVISFVDRRYSTKVRRTAAGDRLVFFIARPGKAPRPGAYFLACGKAYETMALKPAVLRRLK